MLGFTGLVPKFKDRDIPSGLAANLLEKVLGSEDTTEELLKFVISHLYSTKISNSFDASNVDLISVLSRTSDYSLIKRLLDLKMPVNQRQITTAMLLIPLEDTATFDLLLKHQKFERTILNVACQRAVTALKVECVVVLIEHGATPPTDDLKLVNDVGFCDNTFIQEYLAKQDVQEHTQKSCDEGLDLGACKVGLI